MALAWEDAGTGEPGDQNADSAILEQGCTSMYWSLGPDGPDRWGAELIGVNHGDELPLAGLHLGHFPSAELAKAAAQVREDTAGR